MEFYYELKVPDDRIAVVVGKRGVTKRLLMQKLGVNISVLASKGIVNIRAEDGGDLIIAKDIIRAIAAGFNPEIALKLLDSDYFLDVIDIAEYVRNCSRSKLNRLRGRLIGRGGKSRRSLSTIAQSDVVVRGKSIAILGPHQYVMLVRRAVESLLAGSKHGTAYKWLEENCKKVRRK